MAFNWKPIKNIDYIINYYKILEIDEQASTDDIKKQYKKLATEYHPDKFQKAGSEIQSLSSKKMSFIQEAYNILGTDFKKQIYDKELAIFNP